MICTKCKAELPDGYRFCYKCGTMFAFPGETPEESVRLAKEQYQKYVAYVRAQQQAREAQLALQQTTPQQPVQQPVQQPQYAVAQYQQPAQPQQVPLQPRANYAASNYAATYAETHKTTSAAAITAPVLGIVALGTSFLPIINNASFFMALLGLVLSIVGIVATKKGKPKKGRGLAVASLAVNVLAIVIVLATQSMFSSAIKSVTDGPKPVAQQDTSSLAIGQSVTLDNGLTVAVLDVKTGLKQFDTPITQVTVSYSNDGRKNASFNVLDWKAEHRDGSVRMIAVYGEGVSDLGSGELTPGGERVGNVYFEGDDITKVHYYGNALVQDEPSASWAIAQDDAAQPEQAFEAEGTRAVFKGITEPTKGNAMVNFALDNQTGSTVIVGAENVVVNGEYSVGTLGGSATPIQPGTKGAVGILFGYTVQTPLTSVDEIRTVSCDLVLLDYSSTSKVLTVPVTVEV
ncbi:MAG: hypothetical protein IJI15_03320 [Atopobiaceae bacterium]|nr:hypothetical protein [Atopobiaceae bacterium]